MSFFEHVEMAAIDPIFGINTAFKNDPREEKINLGVGTYKTEKLEPYVLETVKTAERLLLDANLNKDYLPIEGDPEFLKHIQKLVLGEGFDSACVLQTIGGTGALRVGADFLQQIGFKNIHLPSPTWDNHRRVFTHARFDIAHYPYYDSENKRFDLESMIEYLRGLQTKSVILLQASCHNPTGFDPTLDEWKKIAKVIKEKELMPFFDFAYQGFGDGLEQDASALRLFMHEGIEFLIAASFSKNFGLYAERLGALFVIGKNQESAKRATSQLKVIIRGIYSNPACHGARIVAKILGDNGLRKAWEKELHEMKQRITQMRSMLISALNSPRYDFMKKQKGMFSYTGLEKSSVARLVEEFAIYLPSDGRINVAGLNKDNLDTVVKAISYVDAKS